MTKVTENQSGWLLRNSLIMTLLLGFALSLACEHTAQAKPITIKLATLVPKGSDYFKVLQDMANDWSRISNGRVKVLLYPGGIVGDETDMVRKMHIGQLQAAAISTQGLQDIDKSVYALNYPMMVHSWDELDWLRDHLGETIKNNFHDKGFTLLFWADVGWVYFFSTRPILKPQDVKDLKLFTRANDFADLDLWKTAGFNPVPLTMNDVLPGLQTGLINVVQAPAFIALSSQWFGIANHMLDLPWAAMSGGLVITNDAWSKIPPTLQDTLKKAARHEAQRIHDTIRYHSDDAVDIMKEHGLIVHEPSEKVKQMWQDETESYYPKFKGVLVSDKMHERLMELWPKLKAYRQSKQDSTTQAHD